MTTMTEHHQRFEEETLKLRPVAPLSDQKKPFTYSHSEQSEDAEERSASYGKSLLYWLCSFSLGLGS